MRPSLEINVLPVSSLVFVTVMVKKFRNLKGTRRYTGPIRRTVETLPGIWEFYIRGWFPCTRVTTTVRPGRTHCVHRCLPPPLIQQTLAHTRTEHRVPQ